MVPITQCAPQPHAAVHDPLAYANFTLDSSGVAGFFGGDTAVHGMATVNLFQWRKWGGWYNTPGSYDIAKQYGRLASGRLCGGLFPGDGGGTDDPSQLFGLDGKSGPESFATRSGSWHGQMGHPAMLIVRMARSTKYTVVKREGTERVTTPVTVTVIDLPKVPEEIVYPTLSHHRSVLLAVVPIGASIGACIGCALTADWWSFSSILLGMLANGCTCFVLGSGKLTFKHCRPAQGAARSASIFTANRAGVVVIRGEPGAVNCLTRGRFYLEYEKPSTPASVVQQSDDGQENLAPLPEQIPPAANNDSVENGLEKQSKRANGMEDTSSTPNGAQPNSFRIGLCSILLTIQFLVQLLLIPQGVLFGQIMFLSTLAVSWGYNTYLSSINREDVQTSILCRILELEEKHVRKFEFGTWTAMCTFACLVLHGDEPLPSDALTVLNALLPQTSEVWVKWREVVNAKLRLLEPWTIKKPDYEVGVGPAGEAKSFSDEDQELLRDLLLDAQAAHNRYLKSYPPHRG